MKSKLLFLILILLVSIPFSFGFNITLMSYCGLNSSDGCVPGFNTSNLEEIERMSFTYQVNSSGSGDIDSIYLNFTADGDNACSLGNRQATDCYSYSDPINKWIQFINGSITDTYDSSNYNQGDIINISINKYSSTLWNITYIIDEHYNPNVFKHYNAKYNFSDIKWQTDSDKRITKESLLRILVRNVPIDADQYKMDFRVTAVGSPTNPLIAYACNSTYSTGRASEISNCQLIVSKLPSEFQDTDNTKFRGIFTKELVDNINEITYIILETNIPNPTKYYAIKTYKALNETHPPGVEYSTNGGDTWADNNDGYETELNLNWFNDGVNNTKIKYLLWANTSTSASLTSEDSISWDIDSTQKYSPLINIITPTEGYTITSNPYLITWESNDPNNDNLNISIYYDDELIVCDLNQTTTSYLWNLSSLTEDSTYTLTVNASKVIDSSYSSIDTHSITKNLIPVINGGGSSFLNILFDSEEEEPEDVITPPKSLYLHPFMPYLVFAFSVILLSLIYKFIIGKDKRYTKRIKKFKIISFLIIFIELIYIGIQFL